MNTFQDSLKDLMSENNLNGRKLSLIMEVTPNTIYDFFKKDFYPSIDLALKMSEYFNCSIDYLLGLTDKRECEYDLKSKDQMLKNFNNNIIQILKSSNISIAKAMKEMKIGEFTFYRWRRGEFPKTINLITISKYLSVSIEYLLGHECK